MIWTRRKRWLIGVTAAIVGVLACVFIAASIFAKRFEPHIRQLAVNYLSRRFESEVEIGRLSVNIPRIHSLQLFLTRGRGVIAEVLGQDIVLRHKGRRDVPPMFSMKSFHFEVDLGRVFDPNKRVALVRIDRLAIHIPPKGGPPASPVPDVAKAPDTEDPLSPAKIFIERVIVTDSKLVILPRNKDRLPLEFDLHRIVLNSVQLKEALSYQARLMNPKPPGVIDATGSFGPWNPGTPSDTPLSGDYTLANADLSVFSAIAGKLNSRGSFKGTLSSVEARGEADVPDFQLRKVGHPMGLHVNFETLVDGTNGNTILEPIHAQLNTSQFMTSGAVLKHDGDTKRSIELDVRMSDGEMLDLLRLAMKNKPFMAGRIDMASKIRIPPLNGKVSERLILDGTFRIRRGQFLQEVVQDKVDTLSRKGQGQPKNESIENVFSNMAGAFHMEDQQIAFKSLSFEVPGSQVDLAGLYNMEADELDFNGSLRLKARVSQTMTGWKRWLLKPVDPFFAKKGAGTYLKIKITGTSKEPNFGASR